MTKQSRHRARRRASGLCLVEGCEELSGADARCPDHAAQHSVAMRLNYHQRRARGLCGWAGCKFQTAPGRAYCPTHTEHNRRVGLIRQRERTLRERRFTH